MISKVSYSRIQALWLSQLGCKPAHFFSFGYASLKDSIVLINRAWNRSASFRVTQWLKIIPHINEPVISSHCVHLKLWHRFHALLNVCSDHDDNVPLMGRYGIGNVGKTVPTSMLKLSLNQEILQLIMLFMRKIVKMHSDILRFLFLFSQ